MNKGLGKGVGVPVKLLHESEGHVVTVRVCARVAMYAVHPSVWVWLVSCV